jgi:hypothetical protein
MLDLKSWLMGFLLGFNGQPMPAEEKKDAEA